MVTTRSSGRVKAPKTADDPILDNIDPSSDDSFQPSEDEEPAEPAGNDDVQPRHPAEADDSFQPSEDEEPAEPAGNNDAQPEHPAEADDPAHHPNVHPDLEKLPFGFERPVGQPADEFSRTYTLKELRRHLSIDARIQALLMEDIESYIHYGPRANPALRPLQYIIWTECANEPRAAICNDLSQVGFSMDIVRAVFDGQWAKGHSNRATGYFLYQHYSAVKKRIGQRKKRRRSGAALAAEKEVAEDKKVSEAAMERIIETVIARTAPEVNALAERVAVHDRLLEKNDEQLLKNEKHLRENDKQFRKQARRIQKHADRLATIDGKLTAIHNSGVETARGIGKLMEMMSAKV